MNISISEKTRKRAVMVVAAALAATALVGCSGEKSKTETRKAATTAAAAPAATAVEVKKGDPVAGKKIYFKHCHYCHGREGRGDGPVGIAISPHPADFVGDRKRMAKTDAELFKSITNGIYKQIGGEEMAMPRWAEILTVQERWDVLSYVRQLEREGLSADKKR